jgi:NAD(P)-dependent dehydrogenase (short-subunit alcohol dehydrogenase family)
VNDLLGLTDRVAIVTGGAGNIGHATSLMLAQAGAHVVAADIDAGALAVLDAELQALGSESVTVEADTRSAADIDRVVHAALDRWDRVDVGVNVVGGGDGMGKTILEASDAEWDSTFDTNLMSAVRCCRAYATAMTQRGTQGSIVNIASPAGLRASPGMVAYGASKAALINFSWTLAVELAPAGIRVNVVVPAFVPRPGMLWGGTPEQQDALAKASVPMGRVTLAEDVAGAIVCFASRLTSFSTGQVLACDGGRLLTNPINPGPRPS